MFPGSPSPGSILSGAITRGIQGTELGPMEQMARVGVSLFSDGGKCVNDSALMRRAFRLAGDNEVTIVQHAQGHPIVGDDQINAGRMRQRPRDWHRGHRLPSTSSLRGMPCWPPSSVPVCTSATYQHLDPWKSFVWAKSHQLSHTSSPMSAHDQVLPHPLGGSEQIVHVHARMPGEGVHQDLIHRDLRTITAR